MQKHCHNKICHFNLVSAQSLNIPGLLFGSSGAAAMVSVGWHGVVSSQWARHVTMVSRDIVSCLTVSIAEVTLLICPQLMDHHFHFTNMSAEYIV